MDKQQSIEAWHAAERRLLSKHKDEYDELRIGLRLKYHAEKSKNEARRQIVKKHYTEFRILLTEEKKRRGGDDSKVNAFRVRMALLKVDGVPQHVIDSEIERLARSRAKILLRQHHYPEYKANVLSWKERAPHISAQSQRSYSDDDLLHKYKQEYSQFLKDCREELRDAVNYDD
jgi:hypothetical protein